MNSVNENDWFFVTDRANLLTMFSSGVIQLAENEFRHRADIRDKWNGLVVFFKGNIPQDFEECLTEEGRVIPVVLRFKSDIEKILQVTEIKPGLVVGISEFPVSLELLESAEFTSDDHRIDSLQRLFPEGSIGEKYCSESLFDQFNTDVKLVDCMPVDEILPYDKSSFAIDDIAGGVSALLQLNLKNEKEVFVIGGIATDLDSICRNTQLDSTWLIDEVGSKDEELKSAFDKWLWQALVKKLIDLDTSGGFGSVAFLNELINDDSGIPAELQSTANTWRDVVQKVLESEKPLPDLSVKGWPIQRGALLFLLRKTPENLLYQQDSDNIDFTTKAVAVAFSGCLSGLMGLNEDLRPKWPVCLSVVKSLIESIRGGQSSNLVRYKFELTKEAKKTSEAEAIVTLMVGGESIRKYDLKTSNVNKRIYDLAVQSSYEIEIDCSKAKHSFLKGGENSNRKGKHFYVTRINQSGTKFRPIRIEAVCKDLSSKSALGAINKSMLVNLMRAGGTPNGSCRYSISDGRNAIVVVKDQLSDSIGPQELEAQFEAIEIALQDYRNIVSKVKKP